MTKSVVNTSEAAMNDPIHILFVDDDPIFCEYFQGLSNPFNLNLEVLHTFREAKARIESTKFSAYIFDANLADGSGFDLASMVRKKYGREVPIVVISGVFRDSEHFKQLKESLQVDYVLDKPILADDAHALLAKLCAAHPSMVKESDPMQRLREKYIKMIPGILKEVEALLLACKDSPSVPTIEALKKTIHKIAGSAGSVGYPEVSQLCKQWERELILTLSTIETTPIEKGWFATQDEFFSRMKFHYQVDTQKVIENPLSHAQSYDRTSRLPLFVVDSDRTLLDSLEREYPEFEVRVSTEWDPEKALKLLEKEDFNPRVVIVGDTFRASSIKGMDLIQAVRSKKNYLQTIFGIILEHHDLAKRAQLLQDGITYVLEKPISGVLFLDAIRGAALYDKHPQFKVIIVDDDPVTCDFIAASLAEVGVSTRVLTDGTHLFEAMEEFKPNVLLLDIYMPGYSGVELLKTLRSDVRFRSLVIVIITASQDNGLLSEAYSDNVDDILHKPLDKRIVQNRILSLARKQAYDSQFAKADSTTGLPNATAFRNYVHEKMLNAESARRGFFIALIEIDQFRKIADTSEGYQVLSRFSNLLMGQESQLGYEAYLGRGRFAILSEYTDRTSFQKNLESFLDKAWQLVADPKNPKNKMSYSCGIIGLPSHYESIEQLFQSAEKTLDEARQKGWDLPVKVVSHERDLASEFDKRKVILIDPDEDLIQILSAALENKGINVASYSLGEPFLEDILIKEHPMAPLVITERLLPDMDGIEVIRRLHKRFPIQLPVIFLTSLSAEKDIMDGLKAGALDYITKPFNLGLMVQKSLIALKR